MSALKKPKIGLYQAKDRALQKRMSYEKVSLTWKNILIYRFLGDATLGTGSAITDIQDNLFLENTDRRYDEAPVEINAAMEELNEQPYDLGKFGIINVIGDTQLFRVHINSLEADGLGRYVIVGDVISVPFLQNNGNNNKQAFFEVTDVDRRPEFEKFYILITTVPIKDTQEFEDIDGIESNSDVLDDLQSQMQEMFDDTYTQEGLSPEPSLFCERGFVEAGFWDKADTTSFTDEGTREDYNPQPNSDWLDGEIF